MSQTMTIARGETLAFRAFVKKNGKPVDITGWRIVFKCMQHLSDPDSACIALLDNLGEGGASVGILIVTPQSGSTDNVPNLGAADVTMPGANTYGLPDVGQNVIGELWARDPSGSPWRAEVYTISVTRRGLQAQP